MTRYDDAGLVTDDPVVAAMFLGWPGDGHVYRIHSQKEQFDLGDAGWCKTVTIPWPLVYEAIQPVEGEGCVYDYPTYDVLQNPLTVYLYRGLVDMGNVENRHYHKRVLNLITTRAELRELVAKARPKEGEC